MGIRIIYSLDTQALDKYYNHRYTELKQNGHLLILHSGTAEKDSSRKRGIASVLGGWNDRQAVLFLSLMKYVLINFLN
jgi:hypothetical protein